MYKSGEVGSASPPGGNLVDGLPPARHTDPLVKQPSLAPAKICDVGREYLNLNDALHFSSKPFIFKFNFPWVSALVLDQTQVLNPCLSFWKCWYFDAYFQSFQKKARKLKCHENFKNVEILMNIFKIFRKFTGNSDIPGIYKMNSSLSLILNK